MATAALAVLGALLTIIKMILGHFSPESKLRRLELWLERKKTAAAVEAQRLEATNSRIDREPDKAGQDLVDRLNEQFGGEPKKGAPDEPTQP